MKNTWLHSMVLVFLLSVFLAAAELCVSPVLNRMTGVFADTEAGLGVLSPPVMAFASLAPALVCGWFTRRHPLLVGAAAGVIATVMVDCFAPSQSSSYSLVGDALASAMYAAVAALAGRTLRYRFRPGNVAFPAMHISTHRKKTTSSQQVE